MVIISIASAPSGNDEAVYTEVHETPAEKFSMDENACYEGIKSKSTDFKKENSLAQYQACKGVFVVLMIALLLLLGTISACIAFAVEISKLKTEISSLQMEQLLLIALIPSSCAALPPSSSSGYYWIQPSIGSAGIL